jgi:ribosomal protein S18 acetylase RimI-like enzyme
MFRAQHSWTESNMNIIRMNQTCFSDLRAFMLAIEADEPSKGYFHPYGRFEDVDELDAALQHVVANAAGADPHFLGYEGLIVAAYGFLRGWAEGYSDAFIGLAVHPKFQGQGLGREMALHLIGVAAAAAVAGASCELKMSAYKTNERSIALSRSLGFVLQDHPRREGEYLGILDLTPWMT